MSARQDLLDRVLTWFVENGVGDTSLRTLAAGLGTSHRMLIYHFGSRDRLLGAVVEQVERHERAVLEQLLEEQDDPAAAAMAFWGHVADTAGTFAPLFFELSGQAMQGKEWAAPLREWLVEGWIEALGELYRRAGLKGDAAERTARLTLAMARGVLFDLALTGDRATADAAVANFTALLTGAEGSG
ncbi:TetR/AcrR family transcriptional regulator [Ornithinimicrobium cerasi]|uniref:TetR/AcrR family transcriptional regulator n=1 Tax=Ornithinimicrobium cerasi TaxID=2248773 RepID=UPI000F002712|nr:TetR family transcriptional regulator [Ornithinimicrobium cerasi]